MSETSGSSEPPDDPERSLRQPIHAAEYEVELPRDVAEEGEIGATGDLRFAGLTRPDAGRRVQAAPTPDMTGGVSLVNGLRGSRKRSAKGTNAPPHLHDDSVVLACDA